MNDSIFDTANQPAADDPAPVLDAGDTNGLRALANLRRLLDNGQADQQLLIARITELRQGAAPAIAAQIDKYLVSQLAQQRRARLGLEEIHAELKSELQRLLSPPYYPARYLGPAEWQGEHYVRVAVDGGSRVVALAEGVQGEALRAGDEVYLSHERNAVLARSPRAQAASGETTAFSRFAADGRVIVSEQGAEIVVTAGAGLDTDSLRPGDLLLWDRSARMALSRIDARDDHLFDEIGDTEPQQLAGLDDIRDGALARFVFRIAHPELASQYRLDGDAERRLLLHGPPGNGKTTLMRIAAAALARASDRSCRVITISGASHYSPYVGETERNTRRCFAALDDYDGPAILFIDEIDAIGRTRGNPAGHHDDRFLGTLLAEIEGIRRSDVAIIAATNRPDALDPALRSRFAAEILLPRPNQRAAREIFAVHLAPELPFAAGSEFSDARAAAIETAIARLYDPNADNAVASLQFRDGKRREVAARDLVSGRLIAQISAAASASAFERHCRDGEPGLSVDDMQTAVHAAIERLRATLSVGNVRSYLTDIPRDLDVVEVEAVRPRVERHRYTRSRPAPAGGIHG